MALSKFKLALKDFEAVKKAKPRDQDAQVSHKQCVCVLLCIPSPPCFSLPLSPPLCEVLTAGIKLLLPPQNKFIQCQKIVRQQAFARAIASEPEKKPSESIDIDSMGKGQG